MFSWLPKNVSTFGGDIDSLLYLIYYVVSVWFVLTYGVIIYCLIRFRYQPERKAQYIHGNTPRQYGWVLGLGAIVLLLDISIDVRGEQVWQKIKGQLPEADVEV